jgi:hypothetical protein
MVTYAIEHAGSRAAAIAQGRRPAPVPGTEVELGQFTDPEGHLIGLTKAAS